MFNYCRFVAYFEQYLEYDSFFVAPEYPNPWVSDNIELWEQEKLAKDISARRVKRWAFSLQELLQDSVGREHFIKFLDKEFSGENLKLEYSINCNLFTTLKFQILGSSSKFKNITSKLCSRKSCRDMGRIFSTWC